jgi:hypothetical protein
MLLNAKILKAFSNQYGCLEGFCIPWEESEKIQISISKLILPPL